MSTVDQMSSEVRATMLGASESSMVVGLSPFGDGRDLYLRKKGLRPSPATTEVMQRGNRQEDFIATELEAYFGDGAEVRAKQLRVLHPDHQWLGATLDGILYRGIEQLGVAELKMISSQSPWAKPPEYYKCQVVHQMFVTGIPKGYLAAWFGKAGKLKVWEFVLANELEWWKPIFDECSRFWHENILAGVEPQPKAKKERTWADLPSSLLDRYLDLGDNIKMLEAEQKEIKQQIFDALGNPEEDVNLVGDSFRVDVKRVETQRVNTKNLPPDIAEAAKETSVSYRLTVARTNIKTFGA